MICCSTHGELISKLRSRLNSTLANLGWTVHISSTIHVEAMEMESGGLIAKLVIDIDDNSIIYTVQISANARV